MSPLLEVKGLTKEFPVPRGLFQTKGTVSAVKEVSFSIDSGETTALVGESGSGKTTVGKLIQGLLGPTRGAILFEGRESGSISRVERARFVQMIFQDPFASLNPKMSVGSMLREAIRQAGPSGPEGLDHEAGRLLESVGLPANILHNYPHQFSGGQRQRLGIARAMATRPKLIVADEPVSALDVSIQAQILNLLADLKDQLGISYLLIAHDLSVVEQMADKVLVMRDGGIVENGTVREVFTAPRESYTKTLLAAVPRL